MGIYGKEGEDESRQVVDVTLAYHYSMGLANLEKVAGCSHEVLMVVEALQRRDCKNWELVHSKDVAAEDFEELSRHYGIDQELVRLNMVALTAQMYDNKVVVVLPSAVHFVGLDVLKPLKLLFGLIDHEMSN